MIFSRYKIIAHRSRSLTRSNDRTISCPINCFILFRGLSAREKTERRGVPANRFFPYWSVAFYLFHWPATARQTDDSDGYRDRGNWCRHLWRIGQKKKKMNRNDTSRCTRARTPEARVKLHAFTPLFFSSVLPSFFAKTFISIVPRSFAILEQRREAWTGWKDRKSLERRAEEGETHDS